MWGAEGANRLAKQQSVESYAEVIAGLAPRQSRELGAAFPRRSFSEPASPPRGSLDRGPGSAPARVSFNEPPPVPGALQQQTSRDFLELAECAALIAPGRTESARSSQASSPPHAAFGRQSAVEPQSSGETGPPTPPSRGCTAATTSSSSLSSPSRRSSGQRRRSSNELLELARLAVRVSRDEQLAARWRRAFGRAAAEAAGRVRLPGALPPLSTEAGADLAAALLGKLAGRESPDGPQGRAATAPARQEFGAGAVTIDSESEDEGEDVVGEPVAHDAAGTDEWPWEFMDHARVRRSTVREETGPTPLSPCQSACSDGTAALREEVATAAAINDYNKLFRLLRRRSVDVEMDVGDGRTVLAETVAHGHHRVARWLMRRHKARPAAADDDGRTPLHHAAMQGHFACCEVLVEAGAPIDAVDNDGMDPVRCAELCGHTALAMHLRNSPIK